MTPVADAGKCCIYSNYGNVGVCVYLTWHTFTCHAGKYAVLPIYHGRLMTIEMNHRMGCVQRSEIYRIDMATANPSCIPL
jgi:hypothetical protein